MTTTPPPRLARYGLGQPEAPPRWISELAEELAGMCEDGKDPGTISLKVREAAAAHNIGDLWLVADLVAREWDRLGIRRVPRMFQAGGW